MATSGARIQPVGLVGRALGVPVTPLPHPLASPGRPPAGTLPRPERTGSEGSPQLRPHLEGLTVTYTEDGEPVLLRADGTPVDTWREGYP